MTSALVKTELHPMAIAKACDSTVGPSIPMDLPNERFSSAMVGAMRRVRAIKHDKFNSHKKYWYTSSEQVYKYARKWLLSEGLWHGSTFTIESRMFALDGEEVPMSFLVVAHRISLGTGECCTYMTEIPIVAGKRMSADHAVQSARTLDLRYFLRDLLLIPCTDNVEDAGQRDDADVEAPKPAWSNSINCEAKRLGNQLRGDQSLIDFFASTVVEVVPGKSTFGSLSTSEKYRVIEVLRTRKDDTEISPTEPAPKPKQADLAPASAPKRQFSAADEAKRLGDALRGESSLGEFFAHEVAEIVPGKCSFGELDVEEKQRVIDVLKARIVNIELHNVELTIEAKRGAKL